MSADTPSPSSSSPFGVVSPARVLFLVAVTGFFALALVSRIGKEMDLYRTPYAQELPWGPAHEPLSERVVFCLVDGLRDDLSRELPELNALREQGADLQLRVTEPAVSIPLSHVIITGAPQQTIGMLTNRGALLAGPGWYRTFGNIYTAAKHAGLRTGNVVTWGPGYALEEFLDSPHTLKGKRGYTDDDVLLPTLLPMLRVEQNLNFIWVHWDVVDYAGHEDGAASDKYMEMARLTASRLEAVADELDFSRDTLIITADHGHLDGGGHMGSEPEVVTVPLIMVGAGIKPGTVGTAEDFDQIDMASTITTLLGAPVPTHNQGWPMYPALEMTSEMRARHARHVTAQRSAAYGHRLSAIGMTDAEWDRGEEGPFALRLIDAELEPGDWDAAYQIAHNIAFELEFRWRDTLSRRTSQQLYPRLAGALGILGVGLLLSVGRRQGRRKEYGAVPNPPLWLVAGVAILILLPATLYWLQGYTYSMSWIGRKGIAVFARPRLLEGMIGLAVAYTVARILASRNPGSTALPIGGVLSGICGGAAIAALVVGCGYLIGWGVRPRPWQTTYESMAFLATEAFHFVPVASVSLAASLVVAIRTARKAERNAAG